jgi:exonuclease III
MAAFKLVLEDCYLANLGYSGPWYTWSNKRIDDIVTRVRLDRAVSTSTWSEHHQGAEIVVLAVRASDHNPLLVVFDKHEQDVRGGNRGFKFEDR